MRGAAASLCICTTRRREERHGRCARRIPRGIASEAEDVKKIPTGVGEAGDATRSREIPPPSGRSLELCSGGWGLGCSAVIIKFRERRRSTKIVVKCFEEVL